MNKELSDLMAASPESLAKIQHERLKEHIKDKLESISKLISEEKYDQIDNLLFHSPAGDGYGCDNDCINFAWEDNDVKDLSQVVGRLKTLQYKSK